MATIIVETDDGQRVKIVRVTSRAQYLAREDYVRRAVVRALEHDALVNGVPARRHTTPRS